MQVDRDIDIYKYRYIYIRRFVSDFLFPHLLHLLSLSFFLLFLRLSSLSIDNRLLSLYLDLCILGSYPSLLLSHSPLVSALDNL